MFTYLLPLEHKLNTETELKNAEKPIPVQQNTNLHNRLIVHDMVIRE